MNLGDFFNKCVWEPTPYNYHQITFVKRRLSRITCLRFFGKLSASWSWISLNSWIKPSKSNENDLVNTARCLWICHFWRKGVFTIQIWQIWWSVSQLFTAAPNKTEQSQKEKSKNTFSTGGFHFEHRTLSVVIALPAFVCLAAEQLTIKCKNKYVWCNKDEELLSAA